MPNAEVEMIDPASIKEMIEAIDDGAYFNTPKTNLYSLSPPSGEKIAELEAEILEWKRKGWDSPPLVSQKHKDGFNTLDNMVGPLFNVLNDSDKATLREQLCRAIGVDVLPDET